MDIGFVWDEDKYQKVLKKHNIRFYEVVASFDDPDGFDLPHPTFENRWIWLGQTVNSRILAVTYSDEDSPLCRLITAFDAEGVLLNEYNQRRRV